MAKLCFKYGAMGSGKSIDLMRNAYNYEEKGYQVLVMKPKIDTKGNDKLDSRMGMQRVVDILIDDNTDIINEIKSRFTNKLRCILVDEAQLLSKVKIDELYLVSKVLDIPVICYGIRTNFKMEGFTGSTRLLEIAERIEEIKTLCECGNTARYAARKVSGKYTLDGPDIIIDGAQDNVCYVPLCGDCFLKKVKKIKYDKY